MKAAGKETEIHTPYLVCNTYMEKRLKEVKEAVPDMKIVLNSVENGDNFFASSDYLRRKKDLTALEIPLYERRDFDPWKVLYTRRRHRGSRFL